MHSEQCAADFMSVKTLTVKNSITFDTVDHDIFTCQVVHFVEYLAKTIDWLKVT